MADEPQPKHSVKDVIEFMRLARERYAFALAADREDREPAVEDVKFAAGDQWGPARDARVAADRPVLTENRLPTFIAQVVNDGRQSKPAIRLTALDGGTKDTAELLMGRIRHIEYESDADIAYDTAREQQVTSGRGFFRLSTRYKKSSFEQEIRIERIENQFSVLWDPNAREYDRSDAEWCFVLTTISKQEFKRKYSGDADLVRNAFYTDQENPAPEWVGVGSDGESIQIAEYWLKEHETKTLCRLADGTEAYLDEIPEGSAILDRREEDCCTVCQYIIDGVEIHDETPWIGSTIPVYPQWGKELTVEGRRRTYSLVRFAKDPQRLLNLYVSNIAEQIAQMPKTPFIGAEGQFANHEAEWGQINTIQQAYVQYRPQVLTVNGSQQLVPPPQRQVQEPPIQALVIGYNQAVDAIKAAMGIFDASLGARSNETAGIAIERRQKEADNANFHFHDNEARTRKRLGRDILELIKIIDQGEKTVATRSEDGKTTKAVRINTAGPYPDPETGKLVHHQLDQGDYGVAVSTGKSYTSAREEAFDTYSQIAQADKNFMSVAGDVLFRNLDAPGSEQIAERYEQAVIPPQVRPQKGQQQIPPEVAQKMQLMGQELQQAHAFAQSLHEQLQTKQVEQQGKKEIVALQEQTKVSLEKMKIEAQLAMAEVNTKSQQLNERLKFVEDMWAQLHQQKFDATEAALGRAHDHEMAEHQADLQPELPIEASGPSGGADQQ